MSDSVTLRSHLTGALNDIVESADLGAIGKCSVVCEMVSLFADYQEEGASLFLDAFFDDQFANLTAMVPESGHIKLGEAKCDEVGIRKAVRKAAPAGSWLLEDVSCFAGSRSRVWFVPRFGASTECSNRSCPSNWRGW